MEDKQFTKICYDPKCLGGGKPQPLNNFYQHKSFVSSKNPGGVSNICKKCTLRRRKENAADKSKKRPASVSSVVLSPPPSTNDHSSDTLIAVPPNKDFIVVDFSEHGDLFKQIIDAAEKSYRTPALQIMYYCSQALNPPG